MAADGAVVGRIFKANAAPVGSPWMRTLIFPHLLFALRYFMGIALPFIFIWEAVEKGLEGRNYKSRSRNPAWAASLFSGGVLVSPEREEKPRTCRGFKSHEEMPRGGNISRQPDDIQWPETRNKKVEAPG